MLNLIRMDLRRMLRSKSFFVCLGILSATAVLCFFLIFALVYAISHPEFIEAAKKFGMTFMTDGTTDEMLESFGDLEVLNLFHQTNIGGGLIPFISSVLFALFICAEIDSGFWKNILSAHVSRWGYILSKAVTSMVMNFLFLSVTFLISLALNFITGSHFPLSDIKEILLYLFYTWMILCAFNALVLMVCMATKSKAAGITAGILFGTGIIVVILYNLLGLIGWNGFLNYTLYMNMAFYPNPFSEWECLRHFLVGAGFFIVYTTASEIVLSRKDI